ncbi:MAG TPA: hypothetical protein VHI13_10810 [Candidatus Kapabacteria bacterium]|nr:hypothetical protein [Candidatus Kapabacteria bacterium]
MANISRRRWLAALMGMLAFLLAGLVMPRTVAAQGCCSTYNVLVQNSVPNSCYPLVVTTTWANGISGTSAHTAPGIVTVAAPNPPGCWQTLTALIINGVSVPPPFTGQTVNLGGGCVVSIGILSTAGGCITIVIF